MMELLAQGQNYAMAYTLVILFVLLALLAICIPRRRKKFLRMEMKKIRHARPPLKR